MAIVIVKDIHELKRELVNSSILNAKLVGEYCIAPLSFQQIEGAKTVLSKLENIPNLLSGSVYDENGIHFASYSKIDDLKLHDSVAQESLHHFTDNTLHIHEPIYYKKLFYGVICTMSSTASLNQEVKTLVASTLSILIGLVVLAYIIAIRLQRRISAPIFELRNTAKKITQDKDFSLRLDKSGIKEINGLYDEFNRMIKEIQEHQTIRDLAEIKLIDGENHYRSLFESSPVALLEKDFSSVKNFIEEWKQDSSLIFRDYLDQNIEEVAKYYEKISLIDLNDEAVLLYQMKSKSALLKNWKKLLAYNNYEIFKEELEAILSNKPYTSFDTVIKTSDGSIKIIHLKLMVVSGYEKTLGKVYISMTDITEQKTGRTRASKK